MGILDDIKVRLNNFELNEDSLSSDHKSASDIVMEYWEDAHKKLELIENNA